jgi:hypothetical protein
MEKMSKIIDCNAIDCVYNKDNKCHTMAVNVGDMEPMCDTFLHSGKKAGFDDVIGGIGSCKVDSCSYNKSLECTAKGIHMKKVGSHVDCTTYCSK